MTDARNTQPCSDVNRELMSRFDEGKLDSLPDELNTHLEICPQCQLEFRSLCRLQQGLHQLPASDPGHGFWVNFLPKLRQRMIGMKPPGYKRDLSWVPSLGLALLFALLLFKSPTQIAPPRWYVTESAVESNWTHTSLWNDNLSENDYEDLLSVSATRDLVESYLNDTEAYMIKILSEAVTYTSSDPIELLTTMTDQEIESFLEKLKAFPIIQS